MKGYCVKDKAYRKSVTAVEREWGVRNQDGLSEREVQQRLHRYGYNRLPEGRRDTWFSIFLRQFQSPLIYVLLVAAAIIFFLGTQKIDAFIISGILLFNAIIGTIQEGRTSNIVASLQTFIKTKSVVVRNGQHRIVDDQELVPGDVILLKEGERVPADARVIDSQQLQVDESILTGESKPVYKQTEEIDKDVPVADRTNMVFRGTYIVSGSGRAIIVATGQETQVGKLHKIITQISTDIPLKYELTRLSYTILAFIFVVCLALFVIGLWTGRPFTELLVMLTALFICVIPEGLPVVLTLVLVTGAYRMAKKNVLIRNLQAVEALGRTDVIVIDKTGTLTRNEMMVSSVFADDKTYTVTGQGYFPEGGLYDNGHHVTVPDDSRLSYIGIASALLNTAELSFDKRRNLFEIKGDYTEAALYVLAQKMGYKQDELLKTYRCQYEIPFDSELMYHAGFFEHNGKGIAFVTGAAEKLFSMDHDVSQGMHDHLAQLLQDGLRTVAFGMKEYALDEVGTHATDHALLQAYQHIIEHGLKLLGLCGIQDSIRPEVADIIEQTRDAGLHVVMATGDHKKTALYVAKNVGMYRSGDEIIEANELDQMSQKELVGRLAHTTIFSRVTPDDKVAIVSAFHQRGDIVAMTGDGINDVPSMLAADLGIAMGQIGTEITKQAADIILLDDSFINIVRAIEQGRHIFYTLRRVVLYFFATNMGEIWIVLFALFTNLPLPLTAAQILWLNFVTDGFLDVGLSMEPQEPDLLNATWLQERTRLVDKNLMLKSFYFSIPMGIVSLWVFKWAYAGNPDSLAYARTMTLITMAMFQWFNVWNCRSEERSIFSSGLFSNRWLIAATLFVLFLQFGLTYLPFMQFIFKTVPLSLQDWLLILAVSAPIVVVEEVRKALVRHYHDYLQRS